MRFDDPDQSPPKLFYPNNVRVFLPWPKTWLLAVTLADKRQCGVWLVEGGEREQKTLLPILEDATAELLDQLPEGSCSGMDSQGYFTILLSRDWSEFRDEDEKRAWLAETLNAFVNVLRPFIGKLPGALTS